MSEARENNAASENRQEITIMLSRLEEQINTLRVEFEQYFAGVVRFQPDKLKAEVERNFRTLLQIPLKNSELNFRARSLKYRYNTLDTYWKRVLREKEEGRYHKDLYKCEFRANRRAEAERAKSKQGMAERQIQNIYDVYLRALMDSGIKTPDVSLDAFRTVISQRVSALKKSNPGKKIKFSVVLKEGKPAVEASIKE